MKSGGLNQTTWYVLSVVRHSSFRPHWGIWANWASHQWISQSSIQGISDWTIQMNKWITEFIPTHSLPIPPCKELLTLLLFYLIRNILKIVDDSDIHLMEIHAVVFNAPGWCVRKGKSKLKICENVNGVKDVSYLHCCVGNSPLSNASHV